MQRRSGRQWIALVPVFAAMIIASCGKNSSTTGPRIAVLALVSGSGQSGPTGTTLSLPLVVRAEDQGGQPVSGVTISWEVSAGGGSVSPSQSVSGADGLASATLHLGNSVGPNTVSASLNGASPVVFSATATSAPTAKLTASSGDAQTGVVATALALDLTVKAADAVGNPKAGVVITFQALGGGSVTAGTAVTDALGLASTHWTLGTLAGTQTVTASAPGVTSLSFTATALAAAADAMTILTGNNQTGSPGAALPDSLRIRLVDRFGNPIAGVTITWTPAVGAGAVSPATSATDANGRAATRWTLGSTGGPKSITASGAGFLQTFTGGGNVTYLAVHAGSRHTCGRAQGGVAYCWGYNGDGQLGIGLPPQGSGPVFALPQPTGTTGNLTFGLLSGGGFHTCALTLAGVGYCWGVNVDGRLGIGTNAPANAPTAVIATRAFGTITAGQVHSCSIDLAGRAFCWGANADGELGIIGGPVVPPDSLSINLPTTVQGGLLFALISAGGLHTCAIDMVGGAWCWGNNASGQLGDGSNTVAVAPRAVIGGVVFGSISAGNSHTCGLDNNGVAYCWGANASGQLGTGGALPTNAPVVVAGGFVFANISAGKAHTCGVTTAGALYCWGSNSKGQLGDGTTANHLAPALVASVFLFKSVSAGDAHSCAVTTTNVTVCWGDNEYGQVGDGTTVNRLVPTRVAFQP